jgi:hypothetical protein
MKTKISVASLKPKLRNVRLPMTLEGTWSMKMNHSARPRKKSSRRSRREAVVGTRSSCKRTTPF